MNPAQASKPRGAAPNQSPTCGRTVVFALLAGTSALALGGSGSAGFSEIVPAPPVLIEQARDRHTELRQALTGSLEVPRGASERQPMSRDESEALNRELRQTLRGVYEERGKASP